MTDIPPLTERLRFFAHTIHEPDSQESKICLEAADALAAHEWKPIETAPKDGTAIWAWQPRLGDANKIFWSKHTNQWCYYGNNLKIRESSISHWQPLPTPRTE